MRSFITGSHAYGKPTDDSDVDLAVLMDADSLEIISRFCDQVEDDEASGVYSQIRFGKLQIIAFTDESKFAAWKIATEHLKNRKPVARENAVGTIKFMNSLIENIKPELAKIECPQ